MKRFILPHPIGARHAHSQDDWGDDATIGLHLKTRDPNNKDFDYQFGVYLGERRIGIKDWGSKIVQIIIYLDDEFMHQIWILD